jgi:hypothetical protein
MTDAELDQCRHNGALLHSIVSQRVKLQREGMNHWKGCCPFHDDSDPSFAVYADGRFHCFGCDADGTVFDFVMLRDRVAFPRAVEIVAAECGVRTTEPETKETNGNGHAGVIWTPIVPVPRDAPPPSDRQLECGMLHEYYGPEDNLLGYVRRYEARNGRRKQFYPLTYGVLNGKTGWHDKAPDAPRPLYGLNRLSHATPDATVLLVEGEKAADAAQRLFPDHVAMTWMGGANADGNADLSPLLGRTVVIWPDADAPGRAVAARLAKRLALAQIVDTTGLPDGFDAADLERDGAGDPDAWLDARLPQQPSLPGEKPELLTVLTPDDCEAARPRPYVVKGLISRGDSILLIGQPGAGKSAVGPHIGYAVAQGRSVFHRRVRQGTVLYIAAEDGHGMKLRVRALRRRWGNAPDFRLLPDDVDLKDPNSWHLAALAELIQRLKPALIIIDTLARAFPGLRENEPDAPDGMGRVVMVVRQFANTCEAAVMTLHHMPKDGATPRGHSTLNGDADVTLVVEGATGQPRLVRLTKNRNGSSDATLTFSVRSEPLGEDEDGDIVTAAIADETEPTVADGLRAKEAKLRDKPLFMLRELRNVVINQAEPLSLSPDGPLVSAVHRRWLREALIKIGWFPENLLRTASDGKVGLTRAAYPKENQSLDTLKRAGFLAFNREWVWLL